MKYTHEFLATINFPLLKKQKQSLLKVIENTDNVKILEHLGGIISLINSLQDEAVDNHGYKESTVFKLSKEK